MKKAALLLVATLMLMITLTTDTKASEINNPLYKQYEGLLAPWHKAKICMPCHINTLSGEELNRFPKCSPCHNGKLNLRDQNQLLRIHGTEVCIKCHVGSIYNSKNLGLKVHVPHKKLTCDKCHGDDRAISKPDKNRCTDCHGSNPHSVHSRVLDSICFDCHSEYMKDYLPEINKKELVNAGVEVTPTPEKPQEAQVSFRSLSDFILWIVNLLF